MLYMFFTKTIEIPQAVRSLFCVCLITSKRVLHLQRFCVFFVALLLFLDRDCACVWQRVHSAR